MRHRKHISLLLLAALLLLLPAIADACPTCKDGVEGKEEARGYFWSILFMMSMPFLIFSGLGVYFYLLVRKARRLNPDATAAAIANAESATNVGAVDPSATTVGSSADERELVEV